MVSGVGTNYYYRTAPQPGCPACGRGGGTEELHIGCAKVGWTFVLHRIPERNIRTLSDWVALFVVPGSVIRDEQDRPIEVSLMVAIITRRNPRNPSLLRRLDGTFVEPGELNYELLEGEFS